ncbi:hypothetical protein F4779DRAFT_229776 [Xylariaceae sp. FL0662B]|nr:hypothetical protein F4779DRAFT_229776 [Xylariaceae sp. FL0662B]
MESTMESRSSSSRRRAKPPIRRSWRQAKIGLQVLSLACSGVVIGLSARTTWQGGAGMGVLVIPIAIGTAAWTLAELVTVWARWRRSPGRGIHPAAHVAAQLVLFLALILALFYSCLLWKAVQRDIDMCDRERDEDDDDDTILTTNDDGQGWSWTSFYCPADYYELVHDPFYKAAVQAVIVFLAILWVIHFSLFVRACVETRARAKIERPVTRRYSQPVWPAPYGATYPHRHPRRPMKETEYT